MVGPPSSTVDWTGRLALALFALLLLVVWLLGVIGVYNGGELVHVLLLVGLMLLLLAVLKGRSAAAQTKTSVPDER
jgi:hypothetical protein